MNRQSPDVHFIDYLFQVTLKTFTQNIMYRTSFLWVGFLVLRVFYGIRAIKTAYKVSYIDQTYIKSYIQKTSLAQIMQQNCILQGVIQYSHGQN